MFQNRFFKKRMIVVLFVLGILFLGAGLFFRRKEQTANTDNIIENRLDEKIPQDGDILKNQDPLPDAETPGENVGSGDTVASGDTAIPGDTVIPEDTAIPGDTGASGSEVPDSSKSIEQPDAGDRADDNLTESEETSSPSIPDIEKTENPYRLYFLENPDMTAWIKIPGTVVDYPVMWTPEDEEYYLNRGFDKKSNKRGCLILDTDSNMYPLTTNLIIHGHNIKNAMFGELDRYEKEEYRQEHPYIYLYGRDYEHIYEVMAVFRSKVFYTTDVCFKYYKFFQADTKEEFDDFYQNVKALAAYDSGVEAEFGDHFLTLSTCAYHTENGRLVVVAKEIDPGDYYFPLDNTEVSKQEENE